MSITEDMKKCLRLISVHTKSERVRDAALDMLATFIAGDKPSEQQALDFWVKFDQDGHSIVVDKGQRTVRQHRRVMFVMEVPE